MPIADSFIQELNNEEKTTRRVLEHIPEDQLSWRPHPKSYSLGELGLHVAQIPGAISGLVTPDVLDSPPNFKQGEATSRQQMLDALTESTSAANAYLGSLSDSQMMATWTMNAGGKTILSAPRIGMIRSIMFNHVYHHRGQLLVYLRLLGQHVPSVYGPTADENPFTA
jgi:uncharacterized damage-inducible protein DinB